MERRQSAVAPMVVGRRHVWWVALPHGIKANPLRITFGDDLNLSKRGICKTLTCNRGPQLADHVAIDRRDRCQVYFSQQQLALPTNVGCGYSFTTVSTGSSTSRILDLPTAVGRSRESARLCGSPLGLNPQNRAAFRVLHCLSGGLTKATARSPACLTPHIDEHRRPGTAI